MISNCPICAGKVSVPEQVDRDALCECPLCQARYAVREVLGPAVPEIIIVDEDAIDDALVSSPSDVSEPQAFAMRDADAAEEDPVKEATSTLGGQVDAASFDVDLTPGWNGERERERDNSESRPDADAAEAVLREAANIGSAATTAARAEATETIEAVAHVEAEEASDGGASGENTDAIRSDDPITRLDDEFNTLPGDDFEEDDFEEDDFEEDGFDEDDLLVDFANGDEVADEFDLDFDDDDTSVETQEDDSRLADDTSATDVKAADGAEAAEDKDRGDVERVTDQLDQEATKATAETGTTPIEVVKPFDFKPAPGRVPANDFRPRVPRRQRNVLSEIAKFSVGGLVGLLLCQAGLWWIGRLDPLGIAPKLPDEIGFLAPYSLRKPFSAVATGGPSYTGSNNESLPSPDPLPTPESFFETEEPATPDNARASAFSADETEDSDSGPNFVDRPTDLVEPTTPTGQIHTFVPESPRMPAEVAGDSLDTGVPTEAGDPVADGLGADLRSDFGTTAGEDDVASDNATVPRLGLVAAPRYSPYDVGRSLDTTRNALDALLAAVAAKAAVSERKALLASFYDAATDLADHVAYAAPGSEPVIEEVHNFMSANSGIAVTIGKIAARRSPETGSKGQFLAGTVGDVVADDNGYRRLQLTLLGDIPQEFDVLTTVTDGIAAGDKVFVLGVRVAQPSLEINGYTSAIEEPLIWSEHIVAVK